MSDKLRILIFHFSIDGMGILVYFRYFLCKIVSYPDFHLDENYLVQVFYSIQKLGYYGYSDSRGISDRFNLFFSQ